MMKLSIFISILVNVKLVMFYWITACDFVSHSGDFNVNEVYLAGSALWVLVAVLDTLSSVSYCHGCFLILDPKVNPGTGSHCSFLTVLWHLNWDTCPRKLGTMLNLGKDLCSDDYSLLLTVYYYYYSSLIEPPILRAVIPSRWNWKI